MEFLKERQFALAQKYIRQQVLPEIVAHGAADEVILMADLFGQWAVGQAYAVGDTVLWEGQPVSCLTAHSTAVHPDWTPGSAPSLWRYWHATEPGLALWWVQPLGAHDAYTAGEYMRWGKDGEAAGVWQCLFDSVVHTPGDRPEAWLAWGAGAGAMAVPEPEGDAGDGIPAWVAWDGDNASLHQVGDVVTHGGRTWVAIAGDNHWEPGVFGWEVFS